MHGKIKFVGNPWVGGHPLKDLYLGILLHEPINGLPARATLDLRFRTDNYDYIDSYEEISSIDTLKKASKASSNWERIDTWLKQGFAYANSVSNHDAMLVADENVGFELEYLDDFSRIVDPIPQDISNHNNYQNAAFQSHFLPDYDMADHHLNITRDRVSGLYNINWKGKCGKANSEKGSFQHTFELEASEIKFGGYSIHKLGWNEQAKVRPEERDLKLRSLVNSIVKKPSKMRFKIGQFSGMDRLLPI